MRIDLEVRVVLVTWRAVLRGVRCDDLPEARESVHRASVRALEYLDAIAEKYRDRPLEDQRHLLRLIDPVRREINGAIHHDLPDSGESAG